MNLTGKHVYIQLQKGLGNSPIFRVDNRSSDLIRAAVVSEDNHGLAIALETVVPYAEPELPPAEKARSEYRGVALIPWANIVYVFEIEGSQHETRVWKMPAASLR